MESEKDIAIKQRRVLRLQTLLPWPGACLLFFAAILKTHQIAMVPHHTSLFFGLMAFTLTLILYEVGLALWLASGFRSPLARVTAIGTYAIFWLFVVAKTMLGDDSCGCLGSIKISPIAMSLADMGVICLLYSWDAKSRHTWVPLWAITLGVVSVMAIGYTMMTSKHRSLSNVGQIVGDGGLVVIDSSDWEGKPLPLADYIEGDRRYMNGTWQIVLYRESCPSCEQLIKTSIAGPCALPTVFVAVAPSKKSTRLDRDDLLWRKLSGSHEWFVEFPHKTLIQDGRVYSVPSGMGQ